MTRSPSVVLALYGSRGMLGPGFGGELNSASKSARTSSFIVS